MAVFDDYTVAELTAMRKELGKALATGALRVRYADRDVQYRDLDDMNRTAALLDDAIAVAGGANKLRRIHITSTKGFDC